MNRNFTNTKNIILYFLKNTAYMASFKIAFTAQNRLLQSIDFKQSINSWNVTTLKTINATMTLRLYNLSIKNDDKIRRNYKLLLPKLLNVCRKTNKKVFKLTIGVGFFFFRLG